MKRNCKKEVYFILTGYWISQCAYGCSTLKAALEKYNYKRSDIKDWWKETEKPHYF